MTLFPWFVLVPSSTSKSNSSSGKAPKLFAVAPHGSDQWATRSCTAAWDTSGGTQETYATRWSGTNPLHRFRSPPDGSKYILSSIVMEPGVSWLETRLRNVERLELKAKSQAPSKAWPAVLHYTLGWSAVHLAARVEKKTLQPQGLPQGSFAPHRASAPHQFNPPTVPSRAIKGSTSTSSKRDRA